MDFRNGKHNALKGYNLLLYFAGSMIMYEPTEECIIDFWQKGIISRLPVTSSNPTFTLAASQLRSSCPDKAMCLTNLREDFVWLFADRNKANAPAYESFYSHGSISDSIQLQSNVTDFYDSYGWVSKFRGRVSDDHLSVELLFITLLIDKYLSMDDAACLDAMGHEIRRFIDQHLFTWIYSWNEKMQKSSNTMCYRGIATLICACLEDIYQLFGDNAGISDNYTSFKS